MPYLSVVVPSRNDNHGGDLLVRMQTFINALAKLSDRVSLPIELLIVEWNPPADRPPLAEALDLPSSKYCTYRVVTVPPELHRKYQVCGEHLPLFQMIAKNVGIRRAQAPFVLATNIDLIFSQELMEWLATRPLQKGTFYRVDRKDVPLDVVEKPGVDAQLSYSRENILRVNSRFGTFDCDWLIPVEETDTFGARLKGYIIRTIWDDQRLLCGCFRARRHWFRSRYNFREARRRKSPLALYSGVRFLAKTAVRASRVIARLGRKSASKALSALRKPLLKESESSAKEAESLAEKEATSFRCLHTNACGDFTLLAKEDWLRLGGYAEFEMYSWHLDSLFLYVAHYAGLRQQILDEPIYHIEHKGGWTPNSADELFTRLSAKGIPCLTNEDLEELRNKIADTKEPYLFNESNWGLIDDSLPECAAGEQNKKVKFAA